MENEPLYIEITDNEGAADIYLAFGFSLYENSTNPRLVIIKQNDDRLLIKASSDFFTRELTLHFGGNTQYKIEQHFPLEETSTFYFTGGQITESYNDGEALPTKNPEIAKILFNNAMDFLPASIRPFLAPARPSPLHGKMQHNVDAIIVSAPDFSKQFKPSAPEA